MTTNSDRNTLISPGESGELDSGSSSLDPANRTIEVVDPGHLRTDELLGGRFRVRELIQSGGMGDVYRADDLTQRSTVAVKVLRGGASTLARFEREAARLSELDHPGIPRYIAHDLSAPQGAYLVMEWFEGSSLSERLRSHPFGVRAAVDLMKQVVAAVAHAHQRDIVHRDLNPNNILLSHSAPPVVKVLDFGIAKLTRDDRPLTAEGTQIGTPGYMAPEQVEGRAEVGVAVDVFALGCIFYEVLCGQRAFYAPTIRELLTRIVVDTPPPPSEMRKGIPRELDRLILGLLEKEPRLRPADALAVGELLASLPEYPEEAPPSELAPSLVASSVQQVASVIVLRDSSQNTYERTARAAEPHGLSVQRSDDGTIVAVTSGRGTASDHAVRAARCALAIQRATRVSQIAVSTGLSYTTGNMLSGRAFDAALVSLLLKDADSHLFSGPCLWLDENTASLLDSRFDIRTVEQGFLLRGLRETYEPARTVLGRRTRCIGRKRELSMLQATLAESFEEGTATAMLVTGPPGIGKTRLAAEAARLARRSLPGVQIFRGGAESITSGSPFSALTSAIARGFRIRDSDPEVIRREKLLSRMNEVLQPKDVQRVSEFMGELLNVSTQRAPSPQLEAARRDAVLRGDQILRALQDWLRAECSRHPVVLILDDFQWGDLPTVKFVDATLRNLSELPLVVFALARPEVHDIFPALWSRRGIAELRLSGLARRAAADMVHEILGDAVSPAIVDRVIQRAQGNPFWIEELLRAEDAGQGENVPDRIVLLAQSRIEQQSADERRFLQAASVYGREFWLGGVRAVLGPEAAMMSIDTLARDLAESEFLRHNEMSRLGGEREYHFESGLLRDAAYSLLDDEDREAAHLRAAQWLEKNGESDPLAIAMHFTLGGEADRARLHYLRAAEQALAGDDLEAAISCAEEGLAAGARGHDAVRLRLVHAEASKWRGDNATAFRSAQAAFARAEESSAEWYRAAAEAGVAAGKTGKTESAIGIAKELLESLVRDQTVGDRAMAFARVAGQMVLSGRTDIAKNLLDRAAELENRVQPDPQVMGFLCEAQALLSGASDDPLGRIQYAERSVQYFEDAGDLRNACLARLSQGFAELEFGGNRAALTSLEEALHIAEHMGLENSVAVAELQLGRALGRSGKAHLALGLLERAATAFDRQKNVRLSGMARLYQSEVHAMLGSLETALDTAERAVGILSQLPPLRRLGHAMMALVAERLGRPEVAFAAAEASLERLEPGSRLPVGETTIRLGGAAGLLAAGQTERAAAIVRAEKDRIVALARALPTPQAETFLRGCPARAAVMEIVLDNAQPYRIHFLDHLQRLGQEKVEATDERRSRSEYALEHANAGQDPVLQLCWAAQSYHCQSDELAGLVDRQNINWCTLAAHAAYNAARWLRAGTLRKGVQEILGGPDAFAGLGWLQAGLLRGLGLGRALRAALHAVLGDQALRLARLGMLRHSELTPLLHRFAELLRSNPSTQELGRFAFHVGDAGMPEGEGSTQLKRAFSAWQQATRTEDDRLRAQLILRGNCHAALYEQSRLQVQLIQLRETGWDEALMERLGEQFGLLRGPLRWLTCTLARGFLARVRACGEEVSARAAFELCLPDGAALDALTHRAAFAAPPYPEDLSELTDPKTEALVERFDAHFAGDGLASEPKFWHLNQRMAVLVEVLRTRQQDLTWFDAPLTRDEEKDLREGRTPRNL